MTELPDQCDFCDQTLDDEEELVAVYIGKPPTPRPQNIQDTKAKSDQFEYQLHGKSISAHAALYEVLRKQDNIDVKLSDVVYEMDPVEFNGKLDTPATRTAMKHNENLDKAAAEVTIYPDFGDERPPDMEVCKICEENFKEEARR